MSQPAETSQYDSNPPALPLHNQAARYAVLSVISFVGNLGLMIVLHEWIGLSAYLAVPIAMACITTFNFFSIRLVVFRQRGGGWLKQFSGFIASIAGFRVAEYFGFVLLHGVFGLAYLPAYASILVFSAVCKFVFLRRVVFASRRPALPPTAEPCP